ncbi:translation initiation factor IF-3 [Arthrobacter sp. 35/47]|uniref:translation initiation factor IF-3 n=1 Tax=Arthrobacter sp. 35/47 TaxID=269454 RepID=UPI0023B7EB8A|nr:translation initiation factor IF-3 [Arthrobacter sp. 35/47]
MVTVFDGHQEQHISEPRINDRIRVPEVRLVGPAGEQVGIVRIEDALRLAAESDLDLVEVAPQAKPPVAKLMDFGKYKYEAAVKAREARKNQTNTVLKEIRFRLKIDTHDYETKRGHAIRFLGAGDKVKAMIQFRGREQQRPEMGIRLLQRFAEDVAEVGVVESTPRIDGRNMVMVIGPVKNKAEAKAEARRAAQRAESKASNQSPKDKVDTSSSAPMTQSIGDLLPEELRSAGSASAPEAEAPSVETPVTEAPAAAKDEAAPKETSAPKEEAAPKAAAAKEEAAPKAAAPKAAAPKAAAPKEEAAPKAAAPKAAAPKAAAPKEAAAPKPAAAAPKPASAAPAKPTATPKPATPKPRPAAAPKPTGKAAPAKGSPNRPKPSGSN